MTFNQRVKTSSFISWAPMVFYMSTGLSSRYRADFLGKVNYNNTEALLLISIYIGVLIYLIPKIEKIMSGYAEESIAPFFHGALVTFVLFLSAFSFSRNFDLLLKLGVVWSLAIVLFFIKKGRRV